MQRIYVKFNYPDFTRDMKNVSEESLNRCFIIGDYPDTFTALTAYAETPCDYSTLLDDSQDYHEFVEEAKKHIRANDIDWLEENFT